MIPAEDADCTNAVRMISKCSPRNQAPSHFAIISSFIFDAALIPTMESFRANGIVSLFEDQNVLVRRIPSTNVARRSACIRMMLFASPCLVPVLELVLLFECVHFNYFFDTYNTWTKFSRDTAPKDSASCVLHIELATLHSPSESKSWLKMKWTTT